MSRRAVDWVLAASSGLLLAAASEPVSLAPLAWVGLVPLYAACFRAGRVRRAAALGLVAGVAYFGVHLYWIFLFGWMAWTALTIVMALWVALACAGARAARDLPLAPALAAGWWVAADVLRGSWPWGGYAWGSLGTSQASVPGVRWLAGSIGAYGITFGCAAVAALVAHALVRRRLDVRAVGAVVASVAAFAGLDAALADRSRAGPTLDVAVVQGSVPRPVEADQEERVLANHVALTERLIGDTPKPDVVVWPESAVGYLSDEVVEPVLRDVATRLGVPMLIGRTTADDDTATFRNFVDHVAADGEVVRSYAKRRAVPFGERVPLGLLRAFVSTLGQIPYDMAPGRDPVVFRIDGVAIATPICFESVFPSDVRTFVRRGAQVVVVSTNDASFERSAAAEQHLAHGRMRALEHRRWVVQAAISGVSAFVRPDGTVVGRTRLFEPALLRARVEPRDAPTLYTRVGDLFSLAWAAGSVGATGVAWLLGRRRRRISGPGTGDVAAVPAESRRLG